MFGPNGYGKSALIDAAEWALTAQIERYRGYEEGRREDYLKHIDAQDEPYAQVRFDGPDGNLYCGENAFPSKKQNCKLVESRTFGSTLDLHSTCFRDLIQTLRGPAQIAGVFRFIDLLPYVGPRKVRGFVESEPRDRLETLAPIIGVDRYTDLTETLIALSHALSERLNEQNRRLVVKKQNLDSLERKKQDTQQVYERSIRTDRNLTDWLGEEFNSFRDSLPEGLQSDIQNIPRQDIRELILFLSRTFRSLLQRLLSITRTPQDDCIPPRVSSRRSQLLSNNRIQHRH